jgi:hypothetical protein
MCGASAANIAGELTPQGFNEGQAHNTCKVRPDPNTAACLIGGNFQEPRNLRSRSGRKGRWRDGDGWERLKHLAIIRH